MWLDFIVGGLLSHEMWIFAFIAVLIVIFVTRQLKDKPKQWERTLFRTHNVSLTRACILQGESEAKGSYVACGHRDGLLLVVDLDSGNLILQAQVHKQSLLDVVELPNHYLALSSWESSIKIWDLGNNKCRQELKIHDDAVKCLLSLPNNQLASGSWDRTVKITDLSTESVLRTINFSHPVEALIRMPDNRIAVAAGTAITIIDLSDDKAPPVSVLMGHSRVVSVLELVDNDTLASGSFDNTIKVWSLSQGILLHTLEGHTARITGLACHRPNKIASASGDRSLRIWDLLTGTCEELLLGHKRTITSLQARHDGALVSACRSSEMCLWACRTPMHH